jgi:acetyltransferase
MAADALADYGYEPVTLSAEVLQKLDEVLPPFWSKRNPIDMLGEAKPELYRQVVEICLNAREINGLLIISAPQALADTAEVATALVDLIRQKPIPIITSWVGGEDMHKGREIFNQAGIPTFDSPERAVRAFMDIYRFAQNIEMLQQIPSRLSKRLEFDRQKAKALIQTGLLTDNGLLTEVESKALLAAYGIPVDQIATANSKVEAIQKATEIGYPVVMKINSRDITHKATAPQHARPVHPNLLRWPYCAGGADGNGAGGDDVRCCPCHHWQKS